MKFSKSRVFLGLTLLYAAMIFYISSISDMRLPDKGIKIIDRLMHIVLHNDYSFLLAPLLPLLIQKDKFVHIILYFVFGLLLFITLRSSNNPVRKAFIFTIIIGALYGASDEMHQMFVPERSANIIDLVADITGILIALTIIIIFYLIRFIYHRSMAKISEPL